MAQDYGLRISQAGFDVKTATDLQCVFTSKSNTLKIFLTGVASITVPANTANNSTFSVVITHNLGFIPAVLVDPNDSSGGTAGSITEFTINALNSCPDILINNIQSDYDITTTTLKIWLKTVNVCNAPSSVFWPQGSGQTVNFKYFIFTQQIN